MGIGTILIGTALLILAALVVISPLYEPRTPAVSPASRQETLEMEHAAIVRTIRELDLDYRTGKLDENDYQGLRENYMQRGAATLRELDELSRHALDGPDGDDQEEAQLDAQIEEQIAVLRNAVKFCRSCGTSLLPDDLFCAHCGTPTSPSAMPKKTMGIRR